MYKPTLAVILSLLASTCFAETCTFNQGSCFKLNNQSNQSVEINCHHHLYGFPFTVNAQKKSQNSTQFDTSLSDNLGAPELGQLNCEISWSDGQQYLFDFNNPYIGPTMEFELSANSKKLNVTIHEYYGSQQKSYHWSW